MKNFLSLLVCCLFVLCLNAQTETIRKNQLTIGYLGHFGYQAGGEIGGQLDLKTWNSNSTVIRSYFISPQLGLFAWAGQHTSFLANVEAGLKKYNSEKSSFSAWSIGLGYLLKSRITGVVISLSDGESSNVRTTEAYLLPTLNYAFGRSFGSQLGWYAKISGGLHLTGNNATSLATFAELGLTYSL